MQVSAPAEDPLVKAQREAAERDSIRTQQEGLSRDTSRLMRIYGARSIFGASSGMMGNNAGMMGG